MAHRIRRVQEHWRHSLVNQAHGNYRRWRWQVSESRTGLGEGTSLCPRHLIYMRFKIKHFVAGNSGSDTTCAIVSRVTVHAKPFSVHGAGRNSGQHWFLRTCILYNKLLSIWNTGQDLDGIVNCGSGLVVDRFDDRWNSYISTTKHIPGK